MSLLSCCKALRSYSAHVGRKGDSHSVPEDTRHSRQACNLLQTKYDYLKPFPKSRTVFRSPSMQWREGCGVGRRALNRWHTVFFLWPKGRGLETAFLGVLVCFPVVGVKCPDKSHLREKGLTQLIAPDYSPSWGGVRGRGESQQESEGAGHSASSGTQKQRAANTSRCSVHVLHFRQARVLPGHQCHHRTPVFSLANLTKIIPHGVPTSRRHPTPATTDSGSYCPRGPGGLRP